MSVKVLSSIWRNQLQVCFTFSIQPFSYAESPQTNCLHWWPYIISFLHILRGGLCTISDPRRRERKILVFKGENLILDYFRISLVPIKKIKNEKKSFSFLSSCTSSWHINIKINPFHNKKHKSNKINPLLSFPFQSHFVLLQNKTPPLPIFIFRKCLCFFEIVIRRTGNKKVQKR